MGDTAAVFLRVLILAAAALLPLINPPGSAPIFLAMTRGASDAVRAALARRIAGQSFVLLVAAMLVGSYVLLFFGLSLAVVKIAGGLLVIATAWHLIRADPSPDPALVGASALPLHGLETHAFYPLTFPVTIGPGSISVAVTLGAGLHTRDVSDVVSMLGAVTGVVLVSVSVYLSYRFASRLLRVLGGAGTAVLLRLSAFILLCIGVQILCTGVVERFTI